MILIDANLLIYAYNLQSPHYQVSSHWFETILSGGQQVGIPMQSILAFIRVSTNPKLSGHPSSVSDALATVDLWLKLATVRIIHPGPRHWEIFRNLCSEADASGNLSTDASIAAMAIEHNCTLYTADADFERFPGLRWNNPLVVA